MQTKKGINILNFIRNHGNFKLKQNKKN